MMFEDKWHLKTGDPSGPVAKAVVAKYIATVSTTVMQSQFSLNPSLPMAERQYAAEANEPEGLLPKPWPPADTSTPAGLELTALTKMERVLSIISGLTGSSADALLSLVRNTFGGISLTASPPEYKRFKFEVQLLENGTVIHSYEDPAQGEFPLRDCARHDRTSLSSFLQALVQIDMLARIEHLRM